MAADGERHIELTNLFNLRDLGGYPAADSRRVRWRRLLRADGLQRLEPPDRVRLAELGIRTVVDLRRPEELAIGRFAAGGVTYVHLSIQPTPWEPSAYDEGVGTPRFLADRYLEMTTECGEQVGAVLRVIADAASLPLVFHCAAGKDRTGVVAALTLSLLGVSDDDIAADYGLSAAAIPRWTAWAQVHRPDVVAEMQRFPGPWHTAPPEAIRLFLADVRREHGSVAAYATSVGIDPDLVATMKASLLEHSL